MNTKVNEGKLISGKEALIALANGEEVEYTNSCTPSWHELSVSGISINEIVNPKFSKFRLKTRTITINGIEVPAPFKPTEDCLTFIIDDGKTDGWKAYGYEVDGDATSQFLGLWRTEEEIKQVVAALRQVFGGNHDN